MSLKLLKDSIVSIRPESYSEEVLQSLQVYLQMNIPDRLKEIIYEKLLDIDEELDKKKLIQKTNLQKAVAAINVACDEEADIIPVT
jgi:hypothetical protein